eukprot:g7205.t1
MSENRRRTNANVIRKSIANRRSVEKSPMTRRRNSDASLSRQIKVTGVTPLASIGGHPVGGQRASHKGADSFAGFTAFEEAASPRFWQPGGPLERVYDKPAFQAFTFTLLLLALFLLDIFKVSLVDDEHNTGLYSTLLFIFIFFWLEIIGCCFFKEGYFRLHFDRGFFFWMDVVGTASLIFDIPWLMGGYQMDGSLLRASRTSRVGARAARVTKLVRILRVVRIVRVLKLLKYVRVFGARNKDKDSAGEDELPPASRTSQILSETTAKRIAMLVMLLVIQMPLMTYMNTGVPLRASIDSFGMQLREGKVITWRETESFFRDYREADQRPWRLEHCGNGTACTVVYETSGYRRGGEPRLCADGRQHPGGAPCADGSDPDPAAFFARSEANIMIKSDGCNGTEAGALAGCVRISVNWEDEITGEALLNIVLILCVIAYLLIFTMALQHTIERIVVRPLERIFVAMEGAMADLLVAARFTVTASADKGGGDGGEEMHDMQVLEEAVSKLSDLAQHVTHANNGGSRAAQDILTATHIDAGTKNWLEGNFTTGISKERVRAVPTGTQVDTRASRRNSVKALFSSQMLPATKMQMENATGYGFDALALTAGPEQLCIVARYIYTQAGCQTDLNLQPEKLSGFLTAVVAGYNSNPYHNAHHALDVMQTVFLMIKETGASEQFLVETRDELAMTYNDMSVLENMHASKIYGIMREPASDVFGSLGKSDWADARKTLISCVLATDMVHHFKMVSDVENFTDVNLGKLVSEGLTEDLFNNEKNTHFLLNLFIHASDISNPTKVWDVCAKWSDRVMDEFFAQGDKERERGMQVSPMFDRESVNKFQMQVNFIEFVVAPLYGALVNLCPSLYRLGQQMKDNRQLWGQKYVESVQAAGGDGEGAAEKHEEERRKEAERLAKFDSKYDFDEARRLITGELDEPVSPVTPVEPTSGRRRSSRGALPSSRRHSRGTWVVRVGAPKAKVLPNVEEAAPSAEGAEQE